MKKFAYILILVAVALTSCNDYETYGDKKEKERNAISKFIADSAFVVISEDQFVKNGYKTDLDRHEFVKLDKSGVYMQIIREGCGEQIKGLKLSISLREDTDKPRLVWVSLRSVDDFPCNKMAAEFFNGGGHLNASGGHLDMTIDEAIETVRQAIIAYANLLKG